MAHTLSQEQIAALRVELKKYGLNVLPLPRSRGGKPGAAVAKPARPAHDPIERQIARLRKMEFKTAGVKAGIIKTLKLAQRVREARKRPNLGALLGMFGVKQQHVTPWPEFGEAQNWQALRNGLEGAPKLLTYQRCALTGEHGETLYSDAAAPVKRIACERWRVDGSKPMRRDVACH